MGVQQAAGAGRLILTRAGAILAAACLIAGAAALSQPGAPPPSAGPKASGQLTAFRSDAELRRFLRGLRAPREELKTFDVAAEPPPSPSAPQPNLTPVSPVTVVNSQEIRLEGRIRTENLIGNAPPGFGSQGITNNQEANVDEGGIVKVRGDILVILRRGRLFTVSLARGGMRPIHAINAFPPGVSGEGDWYDEMLLHGDRVIVVGYSYARGGTEVNRFRLGRDGRLSFEDAYHLRSNDYYSSRNYASRVIGNRLVFYAPLYLDWRRDPLEALPGIRKWEGDAIGQRFRPIATARQIFIAPAMRGDKRRQVTTLHSVTSCDLTARELACSAVGVLGPESRSFYVAAGAVYLWTGDYWSPGSRRQPNAVLYRLPLDREPPSAIRARGFPVDQFSFREDAADGMLNVLVRAQSGGDAMGGPEMSAGRASLLRLPIAEFGDGSETVPDSRYRPLPELRGDAWSFHNRFVGDHVLYGGGAFGEAHRSDIVVAVPVRGGEAVELPVSHSVERIEALGGDALVVGSGADESLGFTAIELTGRRPRVGDLFRLPAASEGETRSHAFFFRPDSADGASGILGLPIARDAEPAYRRFFGSAASMLFLRRDERRFAPAGELAAQLRGVADDHCHASCTDWYGNARPIFLGGRIFALLGYELVEGRLEGGRIGEARRVNFAPGRRR